MRKRTSLMLKRAFFLLAILAVLAYLFIPKIVINFMDDISVTEVEEFDNLPAPEREVEAIEIIRDEKIQTDEEIQITETKEQETIYINEEEETQTVDSSLEETPRKEAEQKELSHKENAEREAARHERMQSAIEKFMENIKSPDWYK